MFGSVARKPKDLITGVLFVCIGGGALYIARTYNFGTAQRMGPGYFPSLLAGLLIIFGLVLAVRAFFGELEPIQAGRLKPMVTILLGSLLFGLLIRPAGLIVAIIATVIVGSFASDEFKWMPAVLIALALASLSTIVFVYLLGQPLPVLGFWFR